ncbi:hypothetical protein BD769DRAFT_1629906 [Suillus cothurnatus]|nr:hypothetical protein BD769DRAFT_1629906 [Suillus cothurnatus]
MGNAARKFIDLIRQSTAKWANWDPPIPIQVGAYGRLNVESGELDIEGNIYDPEFQILLDKVDGKLKLADFPPQVGAVEGDFIVCTMGVRQNDLKVDGEMWRTRTDRWFDRNVPGLGQASIKGEWQFQRGKRGALLIMHNPRQEYVPRGRILEALYKVPELKDMHIVNSIFKCGEKISLALTPSGHETESEQWWSDTNASLLRKGHHKDYMFTPLYGLKRKLPLMRRLMRDSPVPDPEGDDFWVDVHAPWDPLDEDGDEEYSVEVRRDF